jgi:hypothetical protein
MTCNIPSEYVSYVQQAAKATGMPESVVCAQINEESGFNPNATSSAGAEGIAQFEPGTFSAEGCSGTPYNASNAFACYSTYMSSLLKSEGGSIQKALEAYNAGPGNLSAGAGYANTILANAGQGVSGTASPSGGSGSGAPSCVGITLFGKCLGIQTSSIEDWLERGALMVFGAVLIVAGLIMFMKAPAPKMPKTAGGDNDSTASKAEGDVTKVAEAAPEAAAVAA